MSNNFVSKEALDGLSRRSPYTQIAIGAGTGCLAGYVLFKASKSVAIVAGGGILLVQLAVQAGVIRSNALETIVLQGNQQRTAGNVRVHTIPSQPTSVSTMEQLTKAYNVVAGSSRLCIAMFGGFLLGFGMA